MNLAIIPARGGSKRIPRKNIRNFCGRPIIEYSILAAQQSGVFDRIIVSTDCAETALIAKTCGAEVPFVRPAELSGDHTPTVPVIRQAIDWFVEHDQKPNFVCCIYATAPLVSSDDLRIGFERLSIDSDAEFSFPVTTFPFPIYRGLEISEGRVKMIWPEHELTRSQDLHEAYHDAGQFYWGTTDAWQTRERIFSANSIPVMIPRHRVQDIDSLEDWRRAELMVAAQSVSETARNKKE